MEQHNFPWIVSLTFIFFLVPFAVHGDETCKTSKIVKRHMHDLYECGKSLKFKDEHDKEHKMTCVLKCVLIKEKILSKDGAVDKSTLEKYLDKEVPEFMKAKAKVLFDQCIDEHGPSIQPEEEFCKSYDPLMKCFVWAAIQVFVNDFV